MTDLALLGLDEEVFLNRERLLHYLGHFKNLPADLPRGVGDPGEGSRHEVVDRRYRRIHGRRVGRIKGCDGGAGSGGGERLQARHRGLQPPHQLLLHS